MIITIISFQSYVAFTDRPIHSGPEYHLVIPMSRCVRYLSQTTFVNLIYSDFCHRTCGIPFGTADAGKWTTFWFLRLPRKGDDPISLYCALQVNLARVTDHFFRCYFIIKRFSVGRAESKVDCRTQNGWERGDILVSWPRLGRFCEFFVLKSNI